MKTVRIEAKNITDKDSFHREFDRVMGFIDGYGMNMDAWIDSMSNIGEGVDGMTSKVSFRGEEVLCIEVADTEDFYTRMPELMRTFIECTAFVNDRYKEINSIKSIVLKFL
jgi:hypothetical protein